MNFESSRKELRKNAEQSQRTTEGRLRIAERRSRITERRLRISQIEALEHEPAMEAWRGLESNEDELNVAEGLGYPVDYFRKLIAQEFIRKLQIGASMHQFPEMTPELDHFCWTNVVDLVDFDSPEMTATPLCKQLRLKMYDLYCDGALPQELSQRFNIEKEQLNGLLVLSLAENGLTLAEIGAKFSFSRERARQILAKSGFSIKYIKEQDSKEAESKRKRLVKSISNWISEHPGCHFYEISNALQIEESEVEHLCPLQLRKLVLGVRTQKNTDSYRTFSREQILKALKDAYAIRNPSMSMYSVSDTQPLTGPYYEDLRKNGSVYGPSQARILQVFGTWKDACAEAGVPSVNAIRDAYALRWTDDELIRQLAEYILISESRSISSFDFWCRLDETRASSGTIRNQIGPWSEAWDLALRLLREKWADKQ